MKKQIQIGVISDLNHTQSPAYSSYYYACLNIHNNVKLVNNVNDFIGNIKTKEDIEKARVLRNAALRLLNSCEKKLTRIKKIIDQLTDFYNKYYKL